MDSWSDLPADLLELISEHPNLSFQDIVRMSSVCSSWKQQIVKEQSYFRGPFLTIPSDNYSQPTMMISTRSLRLLDIAKGRMRVSYATEKNLEKILDNGFVCIGSSREWLFVLDLNSVLWLMNVFSGKEIQLPYNNEVFFRRETDSILHERIPVEKAILSGSPSLVENYRVAIIYGYELKLAYCALSHGNDDVDRVTRNWTVLCQDGKYADAVWDGEDMLYTLTKRQCIIAWDFKASSEPSKIRVFSPSYQQQIDFFRPYDTIQLYLAISKGDILLIHRYIGDRVNGDGEVMEEADLLMDFEDGGGGGDFSNHPLVCPYRTLDFRVFRRDLKGRMWEKVESLEEEAIFLGGNQTVSLSTMDYPGLKKNSIYFSDNYWDRINEDYLYGGHDIGVYDLGSGGLDMFVGSDRIEPTPFWICIP